MSILSTLKHKLSNTTSKISASFSALINKKKITQEDIDLIEESLLAIDIGINCTLQIVESISKFKTFAETKSEDIKKEIYRILNLNLEGSERKLSFNNNSLNIILVSGINGSGKTTFIGKLAHYLKNTKKLSTSIAACDTFRAAAIEQLEALAKLNNVTLYKDKHGADPSSVAYNAIKQSICDNNQVLIIDTAGRLHNNHNLMAELSKMVKVIQKTDESAPQESILVLDGTVGQNALSQVELFSQAAKISSLVVNKLDGSAKGGVLIPVYQKYKIPISFLGIGEKITDLKVFNKEDFCKSLVDF